MQSPSGEAEARTMDAEFSFSAGASGPLQPVELRAGEKNVSGILGLNFGSISS